MNSMTQQPDADAARLSRRRVRLAAQSVQWRAPSLGGSSLRRVRFCGKHMAYGADGVQVRVTQTAQGRRAGFAGLQTCGSVWACPMCSAKVLGRRQGEVAQAVEAHRATGGRVAMATFSVRHHAAQSAATVWDAVTAGHHAVTSGRQWRADREALGVLVEGDVITTCPAKNCGLDNPYGRRHASSCKVGTRSRKHVLPWLRVVEVTHGDAGWHVHVHMLVFLPGSTTDVDLEEFYGRAWERWDRGVQGAGLDGGLRVNHAKFFEGRAADTLADYVTKNTYSVGDVAGLEVARGDLKDGRFGNRSAMQLLRDIVHQPEGRDVVRDVETWHEYEQASKGRRQMTWAHGARALLGLDEVEQTDEEIAAEETGTAEDAVVHLDADDWRNLRRIPGRRTDLLEAVERSLDEALALLDEWGIDYTGLRVCDTYVSAAQVWACSEPPTS